VPFINARQRVKTRYAVTNRGAIYPRTKTSAPCAPACSFHTRILNNTIQELAGKNITLINKIL
jgi:hypothetical protein